MRDRVRATIERHALAAPGEPLWVAVSGGVDSMVLLHLLRALGHPCHVAHVDHGLRGEASAGDRAFVEAYCAKERIPFSTTSVDVKGRCASTGESTQMAARALRLQWLMQRAAAGPDKVATAHHSDDAVETWLMGLMQGVGARGWGGIPVQRFPFIRPLLDVRRSEILAYAEAHQVPWRDDASNTDTKYLRNHVRHDVLPLLEERRPGTFRNLERTMRLGREVDRLVNGAVVDALAGLVPDNEGRLRVPFQCVRGPSPLLVLHHLLREKGFHPDQFDGMLEAMEAHRTGAVFHAGAHRVLIDREELVVFVARNERPSWVIRDDLLVPEDAPIALTRSIASDIDTSATAATAWLDADHLAFPLALRPWQEGDRMRPAGMNGSKLISDILIDAKVPMDRKAHTYVLAQGDRIIWLCGLRLAEGMKAGPTTERVLRFQWSGS